MEKLIIFIISFL